MKLSVTDGFFWRSKVPLVTLIGPTSSALTTSAQTFACGERFHFNPLGECLADDALSEVYFQLLESRISSVL